MAANFRRGVSMARLISPSNEFSASKIRKSFLDFFCEEKIHFHIRSSPVFSLLDPTLAFVNAGMNQFKDVFLGSVEPAAKTVANHQKCIRVGGKHNDFSLVGHDGIHHSFFEMLGNWSFGDYFKKEACTMSWDLLTNVYGIPPESLYVTYFEGDDALGLGPDLETKEIWREIGIQESHILPFGASKNFWEMGTMGPCGACTEIHFDRVPGRKNAGHLVNSDIGEVDELWNLVFTQYNRKEDGSLEKLGTHFVDTGMGFERLVATLQGKPSNYDTDLFIPLFEAIKNHTGHVGYGGKYGDGDEVDRGYRILADHARMVSVALTDGMIPNHHNKVKTVIRRALDVCEKTFKSDSKLLLEVTNHVAETLSDAYPEIGRNLSKIRYVIETEENSWRIQKENAIKAWKKMGQKFSTISDEGEILENPVLVEGMKFLSKNVLDPGKKVISDEDAWILFDTYGVLPESIEKLASKLGLEFRASSLEEYERKKKPEILEAKKEKMKEKSAENLKTEVVAQLTEMKLKPTVDHFKYDYRVDSTGQYIFPKQPSTIEAIICDDEVLESISSDKAEGRSIGLVLDRTQLSCRERNRESDTGSFLIEEEIIFDVEEVVKVKGMAVHFGRFRHFPSDATVAIDNIGLLELNEERRLNLMRNHTGLNLAKAAIREKLFVTGEKYSSVKPNESTLCFMVYKDKLKLVEDVEDVERFVRNIILHDVSVLRKPLTHSQFSEMEDVAVMPGVNLVEREIPVFEVSSGFTLIREHCTGSHVLNTSDLKDFVVTNLKTVGYSMKSIKAVTGEEAVEIRKADALLEAKWQTLEEEIANLNDSDIQNINEAANRLKEFGEELSSSDGISFVFRGKTLKKLENLKSHLKNLAKKVSRDSLEHQFRHHVESSPGKFVICCLRKETEDTSSEEAIVETRCLDRPCLIFFKFREKVKARCSVPERFKTSEFDARKWVVEATSPFGTIGRIRKDPELNYSTVERELSEEQLKEALKRGEKFARFHLGGN